MASLGGSFSSAQVRIWLRSRDPRCAGGSLARSFRRTDEDEDKLRAAGQQSGKKRRGKQRKKKHAEHRFAEGWVEFLDKRVARSVAALLNARTIGGKKNSRWRDDVWTIKYLPKFRWDDLSEQVGASSSSSWISSIISG